MPRQALASKVLANQRDAVGSFYGQCYDGLWRFIWTKVQDPYKAHDIAQQTWTKFCRWLGNSPQLCNEHDKYGQLKKMLFVIARNCVIDEARERERQKHWIQERDVFSGPRTESDPAEECAKNENTARIIEALKRLPDRQQEASILHFYEGHGWQEIGVRLGTTAEAARKLCERATEGIRRQLHSGGIPDGRQHD